MFQKMKNFVVLILASLSLFSYGQDEIGSHLTIVDTTTYNGDTIYVFNDKSWEYKRDYSVEYTMRVVQGRGDVIVFDSLELFTTNWNENKTFSNQYNLASAKDTIVLDITGFRNPVKGTFTSGFKLRWGKWHKGNDIGCVTGTQVASAWSGVVRYAKFNAGGYGNLIIVRHNNGLETYYAHLSQFKVSPGQKVGAGQLIGLSGNTGASKGPHLHFEVRFLDNAFDPKEISGDRLVLHSGLFYYEQPGRALYLKEILRMSEQPATEEVMEKKQFARRDRRRTPGNM